MSTAIELVDSVPFELQLEDTPSPKSVAQQYDSLAAQVTALFSDEREAAQTKLNAAYAATKGRARRAVYAEQEKAIDEKHREGLKAPAKQAELLTKELAILARKSKEIQNGPLKKALKRVAAEQAALKKQIAELEDLRTATQELKDLGIDLSADADSTGLGMSDVDALDAQIEALKNKVDADPTVKLLKKQQARIAKAVEIREAKLEEVNQDIVKRKKDWNDDRKAAWVKIGEDADAAVLSAKAAFDDVAQRTEEAVDVVRLRQDIAVQDEQDQLKEYKDNLKSARKERWGNTLRSIWGAAVAAKDVLFKTIGEAKAQETEGEKANKIFIAERERRFHNSRASQPS